MEEGEERRKKERKRDRERDKERERERSSTSNSPPSPFSSIEDTLRLSVPSYVLALSPADRPYTLARTLSRTRSHACTYSHTQSRARTESRSYPPAARVFRPPHPVSSTLARPACSRPLRVSAARSNHPVPRRVPQGMSLYAADLQLSALSPLVSISPRSGWPYKKSVSLIRRVSPRGISPSNSNASPSRRRFFADFSRWRRADSTFAAVGKFSSPLVARSAARPAVSVILPAATQPSPKPVLAPRALHPPESVPSRLVAHPRSSLPPPHRSTPHHTAPRHAAPSRHRHAVAAVPSSQPS